MLFFIFQSKAQIQNFKEYQYNINQAELLLIDGKKSEVLQKYIATLKSSKGNFCKDIYNALIIADELNAKDTFFDILKYILIKGLPNDYLNSQEFLKKYQSDKRWIEFLKINSKYKSPNALLKSKIDSMFYKDQEFRAKAGSYKVYGDTIRKIDSLNMQFIYTLVDQDKFPGEDEIGVNSFFGNQKYDIVFHHYTQATSLDSNKRKPKITSIIVNLVQQGKIIPNKASHWLEMQHSDYKGGVFDVFNFIINGKETGYYIPIMTYDKSVIVKEFRKWLYLESLDDYYKKFKYKLNNPKNKYFLDIVKNTFDLGNDEETFKKVTKDMELIK